MHYGDQTGKVILRTLKNYLVSKENIRIVEGFFVQQLLVSEGRIAGIKGFFEADGRSHVFIAPAVVIATGGACQIYSKTTNPVTATGDGIALGFRAGAEIADMEFVQFHPTVLKDSKIPCF